MAYQIPLFSLNFDEREAQAAYDTIKSGWISTGPKCEELEQMFVNMFGVKYAVSIQIVQMLYIYAVQYVDLDLVMRYFVHPLLLQRQLIVFVILELHLYFVILLVQNILT